MKSRLSSLFAAVLCLLAAPLWAAGEGALSPQIHWEGYRGKAVAAPIHPVAFKKERLENGAYCIIDSSDRVI